MNLIKMLTVLCAIAVMLCSCGDTKSSEADETVSDNQTVISTDDAVSSEEDSAAENSGEAESESEETSEAPKNTTAASSEKAPSNNTASTNKPAQAKPQEQPSKAPTVSKADPTPSSESPVQSTPRYVVPDGCKSYTDMASEQVRLTNAERAKKGLSALVQDEKLNELAEIRAVEIAKKFDHTRPDGTNVFNMLEDGRISYMLAGENIAAGQETAQVVTEQWMGSEGHRANILTDGYKKIGVAAVTVPNSTYRIYWVQIFLG